MYFYILYIFLFDSDFNIGLEIVKQSLKYLTRFLERQTKLNNENLSHDSWNEFLLNIYLLLSFCHVYRTTSRRSLLDSVLAY